MFRKTILASNIALLCMLSHSSFAAPITDLPQWAQDLLPSNATDYYEICNGCAPHGGAVNIGYLPDGRVINGHSGMPGAIYINGNGGTTPAIVVGNGVTVNTTAKDADGIRSNGGTETSRGYIIVGDNLKVTTTGLSADGINAGYFPAAQNYTGSAYIHVGNNAYLEVFGSGAYGVSANTAQAAATDKFNNVVLGNNATIITHGTTGYGIRAGGHNSNITLGKNATVSTEGLIASALYGLDSGVISLGQEAKVTTTGNSAHGIYATKSSSISVGEKTEITTSGNTAHGVYAITSGLITLGKDSIISANINGTGTGVIHTLYANSTNAAPNSTITLEGGATIYNYGSKATNNSYAAFANGNGSKIDGTAAGLYTITGDMSSATGGSIDLNMTNGSYFEGNTTVADVDSTLNLSIDGANSIWKMDTDSDLTNLSLTNGANVYLSHHTSPVTDTVGENITLTIGNLSGNGVFHLRSDILTSGSDDVTHIGDLIHVTGTSSGQHKVLVSDNNSGGAAVDGTERLRIIKTEDGVAEFELSNVGGYVDLGAYKYELVRGDSLTRTVAENWWLQAKAADPDPIDPPDPVDPTPPTPPAPPPEKNNTADRSGNILNINYLMSYVENQTLLQRMGEIRRDRHTEGDVWVRAYTGKLSSFADSSFKGFDMNYDGIQIGADKYIAKDFYIGMMMGSSKGKVDYEIGDGQTKSYHLGLYGTYKSENGWYVDTIAKVNRIKNNFDTQTGGGYAVNGYGNANGLSLGVEAGKRFYKEDTLSGLYIEPQLQYTYSHQSSSKVKATNGLVTDLHSFDSHIGRASVILGYTALKGDTPVDVYLKTGYVREFDGKTGVTFNGKNHEEYKFNGNWWDNGIGASVQVKQHHNFYLEADYSKGNKFDKKQVNVGYRYAF